MSGSPNLQLTVLVISHNTRTKAKRIPNGIIQPGISDCLDKISWEFEYPEDQNLMKSSVLIAHSS